MEPLQIDINHETRYDYSRPVYLDPHVLRLQPRTDGAQQLTAFDVEIDPPPAGLSRGFDAEGNVMLQTWFCGLHSSLSIRARSTVLMLRDNPFDYLVEGSRTMLPVDYRHEQELLRPYLRSRESLASSPLAPLASRIRDAAQGELITLLTSLNRTIYERVQLVRRETGDPWTAEETWRAGCGACRDLAVLFVETCRLLGVAARFVSGYEFAAETSDAFDLHAWAEAYVPGVGWRGFDPSRGLATTQDHVAVAAAATPQGAAPVIGAFRGDGATATITSELNVDRHACEPAHALVG